MLLLIRHAERGDNEYPSCQSQIKEDPPITPQGKQTAKQVADEIAILFREQKISQFKIITSRFLRCLMTATIIAQHLEKKFQRQGEFLLDDRVSQYLRDDWYSKFPMKDLIYHSEHLKKYLSTMPEFTELYNYSSGHQYNFPQNYGDFHKRVGEFKDSLNYPKKGTCIIIVTHGFVIREICWRINSIPDFRPQIKYCGYVAYSCLDKKNILLKSKL